jgi:heptose-I-phosphate ethanolaminephosphotransferase
MVDDIHIADDSLALYIIHLSGHHFNYYQRYPASFAKYTINDYDSPHTKDQKELIAAYDNACLYNDYVVDKVIEKFEKDNAVVVYFADHGEELYDIRNFCGHMTSRTSPDPSYQLRVPLWVWLSEKFRNQHPGIEKKLLQSRELHIKTDDISHFLIDVAKIETPGYNEKRSFITESGYTEWRSFSEILNQGGLNIDEGINARDFHISLDEQ